MCWRSGQAGQQWTAHRPLRRKTFRLQATRSLLATAPALVLWALVAVVYGCQKGLVTRFEMWCESSRTAAPKAPFDRVVGLNRA
jgi:hypothetical protein